MNSTLSFDDVETDGIKLLELDSQDLLECLVQGGAEIKAVELADKIVLCTSDKTFAVKSVETSNSVFLVENAQEQILNPLALGSGNEGREEGNKQNDSQVMRDSQNVVGGTPGPMTQMQKASRDQSTSAVHVCTIVSENWEIEHIAPDLKQLDDLLESFPFGDAELESGEGVEGMDVDLDKVTAGAAGFTLSELKEKVQASEAELLEALQESDAIQIGDRWGLVSQDYLEAMVDVLVSKVSPSSDPQSLQEILSAMEGEGFGNQEVLTQLVLRFLMDGRLDASAVSRFYARKLLKRKNKWKVEHFMAEWEKVLPIGVVPKVELLKGMILKEENQDISYLEVKMLPRNPSQRFTILFEKKDKWPADELKPFLQGLALKPGTSEDDLLLEFCHSYHPQGNPDATLMFKLRVI
jgi:hypothetical protein